MKVPIGTSSLILTSNDNLELLQDAEALKVILSGTNNVQNIVQLLWYKGVATSAASRNYL